MNSITVSGVTYSITYKTALSGGVVGGLEAKHGRILAVIMDKAILPDSVYDWYVREVRNLCNSLGLGYAMHDMTFVGHPRQAVHKAHIIFDGHEVAVDISTIGTVIESIWPKDEAIKLHLVDGVIKTKVSQ